MDTLNAALHNPLLYAVLVISIVLIALGAIRLVKYRELAKWVELDAVIIGVKEVSELVALSPYSHVNYFYPRVDYCYEFNGKMYESNLVAFNKKNIWVCEVDDYGIPLKEKDKFWHSWGSNTTIKAYVNPSNPTQSVLVHKISKQFRSHNQAIIVAGLLIGFIWMVLKQSA